MQRTPYFSGFPVYHPLEKGGNLLPIIHVRNRDRVGGNLRIYWKLPRSYYIQGAAGRCFYIRDVGVDGSRYPVGIGGKGKRRVGQREDRPAVHGPVALLYHRQSATVLLPCATITISSIPASCAQASFKKNGSGVFMEGITKGAIGVVQ